MSYKKLTTKIRQWVDAGLLTPDQATAIELYESSREVRRSWLMYGIVAIGISAIAIGTISIVASNWQEIPASFKLIGYLIIQTLLGLGAYRCLNRPGIARESWLAGYAVFFLAGIGLTAQVFHIDSEGWGGILFWCALTLPAVLMTSRLPLAALWVIAVFGAESIWLTARMNQIESPIDAVPHSFLSIVTPYLFFAFGRYQYLRFRLPSPLADAFRNIALTIIFFTASIGGSLLWYAAGDIVTDKNLLPLHSLKYAPWLGAVVATASIYLSEPRLKSSMALCLALFFFTSAAFTTLPIILALHSAKIAGTIFLVAFWWIAAVAAAFHGSKRLFDFLSLAISIRLLVVYFEVFGSMMATGLGLIFSGLLVLLVAWLWYKYRNQLVAWVAKS
jgi:uncharacterized membrane protein